MTAKQHYKIADRRARIVSRQNHNTIAQKRAHQAWQVKCIAQRHDYRPPYAYVSNFNLMSKLY